MKLFVSPFNRKKANSPRYASAATRGTNARPLVSTARRYATNLRATANVARLRDPRVNSRSWTSCSCGFQRGASFAASISTRCKCLLRCFDSGPRCVLPADSRCAEHNPQ